ncbi:MAG: ubiquinol-cytochrome c reductase iron-sulfur subunit [Terriglobales bacterium]
MADDKSNAAVAGVLGRLPAWPRKPLNNSVIAAEQAYRKRSGLPVLTEEEMEALRTGQPMPWEAGATGAPAPATPASQPAASSPAAPQAPAPVAAAGPSPAAAELMKGGFKWSKSSVAAEQARRKRNNLPPLTDSDVALLLGEAPPAAGAPVTPAAAPAAVPVARPAAPAVAAPPPVARTGTATKYVGTPAVGTSKAAAAGGIGTAGPPDTEINRARRRLVWMGVIAFLGAWLLAFFRFFLPRTLFEPSTSFKIGYPSDFGLGVDTKYQQKYRIWVDRTPGRLFVIYAKCTHLGCTPDWKPSENKFKCPCHGSGYDSEGINFEGPAPRPMDRAHVEVAPDGEILVDVSRLYQWPKGQPSHFDDPGSFVPV